MATCVKATFRSAVRTAQSGERRIKSLTAGKVCPSSQTEADQSLHTVTARSLAFTKKHYDMPLKCSARWKLKVRLRHSN